MHKKTAIALLLLSGAVGLALAGGGRGKILQLIGRRRTRNGLRLAVEAARDHLLRLGLSRHLTLHR